METKLVIIGPWRIAVDVEATRLAYSQCTVGGAEICSCVTCRNYRQVRNQALSPEFVRLLEDLGIAPNREGEAYYLAPDGDDNKLHVYGGWYHFVGRILEAPTKIMKGNVEIRKSIEVSPSTSIAFTEARAPALEPLKRMKSAGLVELEFTLSAPWVLEGETPG